MWLGTRVLAAQVGVLMCPRLKRRERQGMRAQVLGCRACPVSDSGRRRLGAPARRAVCMTHCPPNNALGDYLHCAGEEIRPPPSVTQLIIVDWGTSVQPDQPPHCDHYSPLLVWSEASRPHVSFTGLLPRVQSGHSLRAGFPWAWPRLIQASTARFFCEPHCPLGNMASAQRVPTELWEDMHLAPNLASGSPKALREKQGRLWRPEVSGSIFSSIVEENRRGGQPGRWAQPRGLHERTDARSGTSRAALFGLAPVPDTGGLMLRRCPEHTDLTQAGQ